MATIDLGRIKMVWRGAYNNATAYTPDDAVSYNGSSYICILASTGNLPTNATYFEQMSGAGTNGTNGTDLGTTLTTQGDLVYRDGSGLQRLGAGTAGQVLQTGGAGANPSWGTVSSDWVKINHTDSTSAVTNHSFQSIFDDTTYDAYKMYFHIELANDSEQVNTRWLDGSTELSGDYRRAGLQGYRRTDNTDNGFSGWNDGDGTNTMDITPWGFSSAEGNVQFGEMTIFGALQDTSNYKNMMIQVALRDHSSPDYFAYHSGTFTYIDYSQSIDGIKFYTTAGNFERFKLSIFGLKK
jgi:hypothetical protein